MAGSSRSKGNPFVQAGIVLALVAGMVILYRLTGDKSLLEQPRGEPGTIALVAFGFVVLASFTIGRFVDVIRLPHITGYLLAGMLFGEAVAHLVSDNLAGPFLSAVEAVAGSRWAERLQDYGVVLKDGFLYDDDKGQGTLASLSVIKTLAVALIAMTAGGELKLESLRRGLRVISGVLLGQAGMVFLLIPAAVVLFSGGILKDVPAESQLFVALSLGLVVAAISLATSPAATIAVVNESQSDGPYTRTILASVVLKDVLVVIAFSIAVAISKSALGAGSDVALVPYLLTHIGGSIVVGAALGGLIALYLRFVGREMLLMIVAVVYTATLFAEEFHLDPVLVFLATGFTASNFSKEGDTLIHGVERLSTPVYVVFFTLAGAELHLEELPKVFPYAFGLVLLRALAVHGGIWLGSKATGAQDSIRRHGWLGFVSQAGVAIVLSELVGGDKDFGATGQELKKILISAVAINELFGPMLLQTGLQWAGETGKKGNIADPKAEAATEAQQESPDAGRLSQFPAAALAQWPEPQGNSDPPGDIAFRSEALTKELGALQAQLDAIVLGVAKGPLRRVHLEAESYFRSLRREFLRGHRRLSVKLRSDAEDADGAKKESLSRMLHREQAELISRWRTVVLERASTTGEAEWSPDQIIETLDRIVESSPEWLLVPYEEQSFEATADQTTFQTIRRWALRFRRSFASLFRSELRRRIPFRALARYHLYGATPGRLEALAELLTRGEMHLLFRARELFEDVITAYERAINNDDPAVGASLSDGELREIRERVEAKLELCTTEAGYMAVGQSDLLGAIFRHAMRDLGEDLRVAGTLDLATRTRRSSKVFHDRDRALRVLSHDLRGVRKAVGGSYRLLAMELELLSLDAQIRDVLDDQGSVLARTIRGKAHTQAGRVSEALAEMLAVAKETIDTPSFTGEQLSTALRGLVLPLRKVGEEAVDTTTELYEQLSDDNTLAPLLDSLRKATGSLSESYEIPAKALAFRPDRKLPEAPGFVEVPFRNLVSGHFEGSIAPELAHVTRLVASELHPLVTALQELSRLIDLKLDLAIAELETVLDDTVQDETRKILRELLVSGFQRNQELLENQLEAADRWGTQADEDLRKHAIRGLTDLRHKLVRGELSQLRIDVMRRKAARRRFLRRAEELPSLFEQARVFTRRSMVLLIGEERLERWWQRLGLPRRREAPPTRVDFAEPAPQVELPLVYRRLFSAEALDLRSLRQSDANRARDALQDASRGLRTAAFVGPEGVGKGAMIQAVVRICGFKSVRRISPDGPVSVETVESWFAETHPGQLVVVSGFHWMVSMEAGGFEPLRRFLDRILEDRSQAAFLMSADEVVWNMASQVLPLQRVFSEVIALQPLTAEELEAVVMARHRLSGSGVNFERATPRSPAEELFARGPGQLRRPYQSFFQSLHEASGGFAREAFGLWLASVQGIGGDFVRMGDVPIPPRRALQRLPDDIILQLVQIARQGWSQPSTFAALYRSPLDEARAKLAYLAKLGLVRSHAGTVYTIPTHLRGVVYRMLRERGWV